MLSRILSLRLFMRFTDVHVRTEHTCSLTGLPITHLCSVITETHASLWTLLPCPAHMLICRNTHGRVVHTQRHGQVPSLSLPKAEVT